MLFRPGIDENRLGIDTISTGATIAWVLELHEKGLLPEEYMDEDLDLSWGDADLIIELARRIGNNQQGLGALLARGTCSASKTIGAGSDFAIQVKGLELPYHHPRAMRGLELAYANCRAAQATMKKALPGILMTQLMKTGLEPALKA